MADTTLEMALAAEFNRHSFSHDMAVADIIDYLKTEHAEADVAPMTFETGSASEP